MRRLFSLVILSSLIIFPIQLFSQETVYEFSKGLSVPLKGSYGRDAIVQDEMLHQLMSKSWEAPAAEDLFWTDPEDSDNSIRWEQIVANDKGWFQHRNLRGGYLLLNYRSKRNQNLVLLINGHAEVWVNGEPRGGDVYQYGWIEHPVKIRKGNNILLVRGGRGRVQASLVKPETDIYLTKKDVLIPDMIQGSSVQRIGAIRLINVSSKELKDYQLRVSSEDQQEWITQVPVVGPFTSRKIPFSAILPPDFIEQEMPVSLQVLDARNNVVSGNQVEIQLPVRKPSDKHKETFVSGLDGSVQYYSVVPPVGGFQDSLALFMTLHGASVEAVNQANAYSPKDWGTIVAPTNRRPYGFDWEDWGRWDAMEVYQIALNRYHPDPTRIYLTGHSMGGHGTWHVGVTFPGEWAAIAPSAGWYSFWSYAGKKEGLADPRSEMLSKSSNGSNTLALSRNFINHGIYILHGDQDDNVPVEQARFMRKHLADFHPDFCYYERPGAGHWWGNECVDWPPLFDFLKNHTKESVRELKKFSFSTANPGISSHFRHVTIINQSDPGELATVTYHYDENAKRIIITTENVSALQVDMASFDENQPFRIQLDDQEFKIQGGATLFCSLKAESGEWERDDQIDLSAKHPKRSGLFKDAFRNNVLFVYGTGGTKEENQWAVNKARFDAETFWYRGNGAIDVISDQEFLQNDYSGRNVILFGHEDMNAAWKELLSECPLRISRNQVKLGDQQLTGDDLGAYFIYPMDGSDYLSVGVIAGTGQEGQWAVYPNRYFVSGSGYPDFLIFRSAMFRDGAESIEAVGFFNSDWSLDSRFFEVR